MSERIPVQDSAYDWMLNHPDRHEDEVFVGNVVSDETNNALAEYDWETKRLGDAKEGEGDVRPVFVKRAEMEAAGWDFSGPTPVSPASR